MIRDITIGQYYRTKSWVHNLDPRTKIISTILIVLSLFLFGGLWEYIAAGLFVAIIIKVSNVPLKYIIRGLKPIVILLLFTAICQLFFTKTGTVVWDLGFTRIYSVAIRNAILFTIRIIFLIIVTSMMTYTTTPNSLTDGLEVVLAPLRIFKVPVHDMAMIMSIALRFIPILIEECDKIMKAQMARGADLESGNVIKKAKNLVPVLVPLFISAFKRANDLALAMESRCYQGGEGRTKLHPLKYRKADYIAFSSIVIFIGVQVGIKYFL
ncbi:MAG: energy-coupling factor transporter transmembrane protein EcfT [Lachnospiraceae bacterium]|nr:energy-coupling factor transporter transmembrane protein EcfT [Lachnospiraceae bacterium]